jgi:hypothetical protein
LQTKGRRRLPRWAPQVRIAGPEHSASRESLGLTPRLATRWRSGRPAIGFSKSAHDAERSIRENTEAGDRFCYFALTAGQLARRIREDALEIDYVLSASISLCYGLTIVRVQCAAHVLERTSNWTISIAARLHAW